MDREQLLELVLELGRALGGLDVDLHHVERDVGVEIERALDRRRLGDLDGPDLVGLEVDLEQVGIADALERGRRLDQGPALVDGVADEHLRRLAQAVGDA